VEQPPPQGFVFVPDFLRGGEEADLLAFIRRLDYRTIEMHGVTAKRRIVQFGRHYSFQSYRLAPAPPVPAELEPVRARAAGVAGIAPEEFVEVLVTEYPPGAGIGWHRDAPPFGVVAGISLAGACRMRFQTGQGSERRTAAVELPPRSLYLLTGDARSTWQHTIPPTRSERYSITFRTLRGQALRS
jgi:alkylated DNA repair dioxygenase AlkB